MKRTFNTLDIFLRFVYLHIKNITSISILLNILFFTSCASTITASLTKEFDNHTLSIHKTYSKSFFNMGGFGGPPLKPKNPDHVWIIVEGNISNKLDQANELDFIPTIVTSDMNIIVTYIETSFTRNGKKYSGIFIPKNGKLNLKPKQTFEYNLLFSLPKNSIPLKLTISKNEEIIFKTMR